MARRESCKLGRTKCRWDLPGADLVATGLDALADAAGGKRRDFSIEVRCWWPWVPRGCGRAGLDVPKPIGLPEQTPNWRCTPRSAQRATDNSHSRYNALIRRLVSYRRTCAGAAAAYFCVLRMNPLWDTGKSIRIIAEARSGGPTSRRPALPPSVYQLVVGAMFVPAALRC